MQIRSIHRFSSITICLLLAISCIYAQPIDFEHTTYAIAKRYLADLEELLAIPNDANYPEDIERNVSWCAKRLAGFGFTHQRLETPSVPLLLAESADVDPERPTMLFYFHIDGQPVDPSFWFQDDPYKATLKEQQAGEGWVPIDWRKLEEEKIEADWRIFARSASDDKSPFIMFLAALETLRANGNKLPYNLKIILDFEEEIGSPNLAQAVLDYKEALGADALIIFDGPKHPSDIPTIAYGARGITSITIKVFGPTFPLHSGHYGNYAPNPALRLSQLLASMKDEQGRVTIPGYYDGVELDEATRAILASVPDNERELMVRLGIGETDAVGTNYQESIQYPSLNIRGMASAWVGKERRTIVPASAIAEIDLRLVVESDGRRLQELIRQHVKDQGYYIVERKPTSRERVQHEKICQFTLSEGVTKAFRTDFNSTLGVWVYENIQQTFGQDPVRLRTMGGTLPTSPFINTLDVPAVIVPLVNGDNNQHSPNENVRLGHYFAGVKTIYGLLGTPYKQ